MLKKNVTSGWTIQLLVKLLFIMILGVFRINNAFALENGQSFTDLPVSNYRNSISKFAAATVGLEMYDSRSGELLSCTGIRTSPTAIMTVAHCITTMPDSIQIIEHNVDGTYKKTTLYPNDFTLMIPPLYKEYVDNTEYLFEAVSSDVGVIRIKTSSSALLNPSFVNTRTPEQIVTTVDELNNYMFNPNTRLYAFGWGSHYRFEYATVLNKSSYDSNNWFFDIFETVTLNSWSYLLLEPDTYANFDSYKLLTLNPLNNSYVYNGDSLSHWLSYPGDTAGIFTNPNILFITSKFDQVEDGEGILLLNGDSGGPLIACKNGSSEECSLVGFARSKNSGEYPNVFVTTANKITIDYLRAY